MKARLALLLIPLILTAILVVPAGAEIRIRPEDSVTVSATYIPVAASTSGAGDSRFVTSLALAHMHSFSLTVTAYLLPGGTDNRNFRASARTIVLPGNGGTRITDPLLALWGYSGLATIYLESIPSPGNDAAFSADAPILNVANPNATFGISIPSTLSGAGPSDIGIAAGIQNDNRYRTNVGVFNDSSSPTSATVEIVADNGILIGSRVYNLQPFSLIQDPVSNITATSFTNAAVRVKPSAALNGQIIAYAVRADNNTNDVVAGPLLQRYSPVAGTSSMVVQLSQYRFTPGGPDGPPIHLRAGEETRLTFRAIDITHGISAIPQLGIGGSSSIAPGNDYVVSVTPSAEQRGARYNFACTNFCGAGHGGMYGSIQVD